MVVVPLTVRLPPIVTLSVTVAASTNIFAHLTLVVPKSSVLSVSETTFPPWVVTPVRVDVVPTKSFFAIPTPPSV